MLKGKDNTLLLLALLSVAGVVVMLYATRQGIGVSPDSTVYVGAARNLLEGRGLSALDGHTLALTPLTHYPPFYPVLLALIGAAGLDPLTVARWLNALLFGLNIFFAGAAVKLYAPQTRWLPVFASFLMLNAPDVLQVHSMAWTEPLFILLSLAGLLLLAAYLETERTPLLFAASLAAALALLTRYVGVVPVACTGAGLLLYGRKPFYRRLVEAILSTGLACLPLSLWMWRNLSLAGAATDRKLAFHPVGLRHVASGLSNASTWLLVGKVRGDVRAVFFFVEMLALIGLCVYLRRSKPRQRARTPTQTLLSRLPHLLLTFIFLYLAFLIFTASFVDFDTVFDERSLAPVHVLLLVFTLCVARNLLSYADAQRRLRLALVVVCLALSASHLFRGVGWIIRQSADAQGYAGKGWRESAIIDGIRALPADTPIYTNGYDAVYFLTGRAAKSIPAKVERGTGRENVNYQSELETMREHLARRGGVVVYFANLGERFYLPTEDELRAGLSLRLSKRATDGAIYEAQTDVAPR